MDLTFAEPQDALVDGEDGGNDSNDEGYDHAALPINILPPRPAILQDASLDSSIILQRHYDDAQAQQDMQAKLWVFPETDVEFDCDKPSGRDIMPGKFLGEGTFGKVYVAKWGQVNIACKRLHQTSSTQTINVRGYQGDHIGEMVASIKAQREKALQTKVHLKELEVLTKLRHPNLVLFLGICHAAHDRMEPTMMLSELMNYSLHDLIEVQRVCLDLPEMLEILLDITKGVAFLHSQDPCVIHANLTSKNVLFKGYTAKNIRFRHKRSWASISIQASRLDQQRGQDCRGVCHEGPGRGSPAVREGRSGSAARQRGRCVSCSGSSRRHQVRPFGSRGHLQPGSAAPAYGAWQAS